MWQDRSAYKTKSWMLMREKFIPNRLLMEITTECNLKCKCCRLWKKENPKNELTTDHKKKILTDFINWQKRERNIIDFKKENLSIVFTGGEPFLKAKEVIDLAEECRRAGLMTSINTNGTLISPIIPNILNSGLTEISFSLDSHIGEIHDYLRGVKGTFQRAILSIKNILENRKANPIVYIQSILGNWNLENIDGLVNLAEELGVDGIGFQPLQFPFGERVPIKWYKDFPYFPTNQQINEGLKILLEMKEKGHFIFNPLSEIRSWYIYFTNPYILPTNFQPCRSASQNIFIDIFGNVKFCCDKELTPVDRIGNTQKNTFEEILRSPNALAVRKEMSSCKRSCGVMLCYRDANL